MDHENTYGKDSPDDHPYLKIIEDSPDGFIILNSKGVAVFANKKAHEMLLRGSHEIINHEIGFPLLVGDNTELELPRKDGSIRYVEMRTVETEWHGEKAYLCNFRDITEHKEYENELQRHKQLLEQTGELARVGGWEVNLHDRTVYWTKTTKMIHEVSSDYMPGLNEAMDFFPAESKRRLKKALDEAIDENKPYNLILEFVTAKGNHLWVHTVGIPEWFNNKCIRLWGVFQDITAIKETEIELEKAKDRAEESDQLKTAFLTNISHEIRTPMNGIMGFANLLKEPNLEGEKQKEFIDIIQQSGERMLNIINELIDIAKIESGQMEVREQQVSVNKMIDGLYLFFSPEAGEKNLILKYSKQKADGEDSLISDLSKLDQVFKNLIKNALIYTDSGTIEFGYVLQDGKFRFFVSDTGMGIDRELQDKIFERFRQADITITREYEGAGLGLSISKAYVEMLGGEIWLESEKQKGTTFWFTIPAKQEQKEDESLLNPNHEDAGEPFLEDLTILVAEDDPVSYQLFVEMMADRGISFIRGENGKEAVEKLKTTTEVDLILMDIKMPLMNGYDATRQIKAQYPHIPIIAQTAFASKLDKDRALKAGCDAYLSKPIRKEDFIRVVNRLLKEKRQR